MYLFIYVHRTTRIETISNVSSNWRLITYLSSSKIRRAFDGGIDAHRLVVVCDRRPTGGRESGHLVAAPVVELEIVTPLWVRDPLAESEERRQCLQLKQQQQQP